MYGLIELMFYWRLKDILGSLGYIIEVFGCKPYFSNKISDLWPLVAIDAESREAPLFPKHVHAALWGTLTLELFPLAFFPDAGVSRWSGEGKWASPPPTHTHTQDKQFVYISWYPLRSGFVESPTRWTSSVQVEVWWFGRLYTSGKVLKSAHHCIWILWWSEQLNWLKLLNCLYRSDRSQIVFFWCNL